MSAGEAKRAGRKLTIREDWEGVRLSIMEGLLRQKFSQEPHRLHLRSTGDALIREGNTWGDKFWGQVRMGEEWVGENHMGRLLMKIRKEIQMSGSVIRVRAPNDVNPKHLRNVLRQMRRLGPPTIRVVPYEGTAYLAVEGSHRLAAASHLGLRPNFVILCGSFRTSQGFGSRPGLVMSKIDCAVTPEEFLVNVRAQGGCHGPWFEFLVETHER